MVRTTPAGTTTLTPATAPLIPSRQLTAKAVYPGFNPGAGFDAIVNAVVVQPDGRILVGGDFTNYQGTPCNRLVRLLADGSPDASFAPQAFNAVVSTIALQPNGAILVGGSFTNFASATPVRNYLVRLTSTGALDPTFAPASTGPVRTTSGGTAVVASIAVQPSGNVVIGGNFDTYDGFSSKSLALLNSSGKGLSFSGTLSSQNLINELAVQPNGKIVGVGSFSINANLSLRRYNADGSDDAAFQTAITSLPGEAGLSGQATGVAVAVYDDNILAVARETSTGKYIHLLNGSGIATATVTYMGTVSTLAFQADGSVLVGGNFVLAGSTATCYLARLTPALALTTNFTGLTGAVGAVAVQPNQQLVLGGDFVSYGGGTAKRLVRVEPAGALNSADVDIPNATYVWNNKSVGDKLVAVAAGSYSATATVAGVSATSSVVKVSGTVPSFLVRITPIGTVGVCANTSQTLTALVPGGANVTYRWWRVQGSNLSSVGTTTTSSTGSTYLVPSPSLGSPEQYFATATMNGVTASTAIVTLNRAPTPTIPATSVSSLPGNILTITGSNLNFVTGVTIGGQPATFLLNSATQLTATVPAGATTGRFVLATACGTAVDVPFSVPAPTITNAPAALSRGSVVLTGTNFIVGATSATINNLNASVTVNSNTQLTVVVPYIPTGVNPISVPLKVTTTVGGTTLPSTGVSTITILVNTPIVVTTTRNLNGTNSTQDAYIIASGGIGNISGSGVMASFSRLVVQSGGTLNLLGDAQALVGSLEVEAGATITIGHPNGLNGAIISSSQSSAGLSTEANYGYTGATAQITGSRLPSQVRSLTVGNSPLTLTNAVSVAQVLRLGGTGNLILDGKTLTLLSNATGTALVVNSGTGQVLGNTAVVQRYINPVANTGLGFRYYGSPVQDAPAAVLGAPVFDYDQSRTFVRQDTLPPISYGFSPGPLLPSKVLAVGRGYRAVVPAATTVQFKGTLTTNDITITLLRNGNEAYNGWNLVSNPYPSPLNWTKLVAKGATVGLEAAIYVYESTGTNTGNYRSYVNSVSNNNLINQANDTLLIAMGQAFFVRVSEGRTTGTLTFRNDCRATSYTQQASFSRTTLTRPFDVSIALGRNGHGGNPQVNRTTLYIDPSGAPSISSPFNPKLDADASNLFSFSQQTISIQGGSSAADSTLAIRAIAPPTAGQTATPLAVTATDEDWYTLSVFVEGLSQLTPGLVPYLHDKNSSAPTLTLQDLSATTPTAPLEYIFYISAAEILSGTLFNRFEIIFQGSALATTPASPALGSAVVFPNPAQRRIHVEVPAVPGATQVQATLFNALGQPVLRQDAPLPATGTALNLAAERLAGGVYILRLQAGSSIVTRRVLLDN